ncbi:aminodeoxychorismate lyase [Porticoccaceae bacterium LTM1]|nr:aminodeoxychorismate lyase [Porticoccaceae bacterium LTM1]
MDRGFAYGHGLFETVRVHDGQAPLWVKHRERLLAGCERLLISVDPLEIDRKLNEVLASGDGKSGIAKLIVTAGVGGRGYQFSQSCEPVISGLYLPLPELPSKRAIEGVAVRVCDYRLPDNPVLAGIKHLNRLDQVLARAEWSDSAVFEGLLMDARGSVIEATCSNLFARIDNELITPKLNCNGVSGVMRRVVLEELCQKAGIPCVEKEISLQQLIQSSEIFITNSLFGIYPVRKIIEHCELPVGEWTKQLQQKLGERWTCYRV